MDVRGNAIARSAVGERKGLDRDECSDELMMANSC